MLKNKLWIKAKEERAYIQLKKIWSHVDGSNTLTQRTAYEIYRRTLKAQSTPIAYRKFLRLFHQLVAQQHSLFYTRFSGGYDDSR
ncbi:hypothetical protein [uncultured Pseudoalteromonas sp.]|jgi:hypothetical protein|uniref:hypothetical protein n=1 Tax=uncultured Pseudoalteromonas sp. TaxID=114053 RepID=UPI0030D935A8|tara:strand:- start:4806 stop:5060 length:255 start_codon:yes stop_codon:yes gene_type:complete